MYDIIGVIIGVFVFGPWLASGSIALYHIYLRWGDSPQTHRERNIDRYLARRIKR